MNSVDAAAGQWHDSSVQFAILAEIYCNLVDGRANLTAESLLHQLHALLPLLYSAALALSDPDAVEGNTGGTTDRIDGNDDEELLGESGRRPDPDRMTHDRWRTLFDSLRNQFGSRDSYSNVFDPYAGPTEPSGVSSISDDIADIYRDLMYGLTKFRRGQLKAAAWVWRFHFNGHWAAHASSALRAIESLASMHDLGFPPQTALQSIRSQWAAWHLGEPR